MPAPQRGFSLVELLIVLLVVMLLTLKASQEYQHYPAQTQVMEGILLTRSIKLTLTEFLALNGRLPNARELRALQPQFDAISGRYLARIEVSEGFGHPPRSELRLHFRDAPHVDRRIRGGVVVMLARLTRPESGRLEWVCLETPDTRGRDGAALDAKLFAPLCRAVAGG